ncbi:MAG: hydrolase [Lachnospiraceae bacterium]|nr:hydrolase [Lachnospiraceae bacterium]
MKNFNESLEVLKKYNKEPFHIEHGVTVGKVMKWFAKDQGLSDEEQEHWSIVGLLHDIDWEMYPDAHCIKCQELLKDEGYDEDFIYSVCAHGYKHCGSEFPPRNVMEKILYTVDELTGLIGAAKRMRPSKSTKDMDLKSLKKKFKDKSFAAGCSRDVIKDGAETIWGVELDTCLQKTLNAMQDMEDEIMALI